MRMAMMDEEEVVGVMTDVKGGDECGTAFRIHC